ncbi:uncharacterized protein MICPUCDRAFT_65444 [Micromonas pusilla CCMP1545]|uniref:Predicted protein n=1 Tax=Micromonas pusilla (strain CCMP1545) TaxID=564608 RepID=C1MVR3_MICPC|nr:uncharacterized protein MICPUCDRAFT_65444 [Micromonas pusilla CCMP1545]EEH56036.1 predicted protein [Micromonas pusilla CCMP1545]|eukprot:XP_003060084.1 predicted protein [Micromonas pusilla CCMP1545]
MGRARLDVAVVELHGDRVAVAGGRLEHLPRVPRLSELLADAIAHLGEGRRGGGSRRGGSSVFTLVPIRPRSRCECRSLRTFPSSLTTFDPTHARRLSTPTDASSPRVLGRILRTRRRIARTCTSRRRRRRTSR